MPEGASHSVGAHLCEFLEIQNQSTRSQKELVLHDRKVKMCISTEMVEKITVEDKTMTSKGSKVLI